MVQQGELTGFTVLITRPEPQALALAEHIQLLDGSSIIFPCINISDPSDPSSLTEAALTLDSYDIALFISPNAVQKAWAILQSYWPVFPPHLTVGCVGKGTAQALTMRQLPVDFYPSTRFNSEELLTLPNLQHVAGKRIVIFKGAGGKSLLTDTLRQRGATLHEAIAYERQCPMPKIESLLSRWQAGQIHVIISTSLEALQNLKQILGEQGLAILQTTPLLVISPTMADMAKQLGIITVLEAPNATDAAIVATLIQYRKRLHAPKKSS